MSLNYNLNKILYIFNWFTYSLKKSVSNTSLIKEIPFSFSVVSSITVENPSDILLIAIAIPITLIGSVIIYTLWWPAQPDDQQDIVDSSDNSNNLDDTIEVGSNNDNIIQDTIDSNLDDTIEVGSNNDNIIQDTINSNFDDIIKVGSNNDNIIQDTINSNFDDIIKVGSNNDNIIQETIVSHLDNIIKEGAIGLEDPIWATKFFDSLYINCTSDAGIDLVLKSVYNDKILNKLVDQYRVSGFVDQNLVNRLVSHYVENGFVDPNLLDGLIIQPNLVIDNPVVNPNLVIENAAIDPNLVIQAAPSFFEDPFNWLSLLWSSISSWF